MSTPHVALAVLGAVLLLLAATIAHNRTVVRDFLYSMLHDPTDGSWSSTRICGTLAAIIPLLCLFMLTVAAVWQVHDYSGMIGAALGGGGVTSGIAFFSRNRGGPAAKDGAA